ncbi:hypothetical protein [Salinibacterium sp. ZJ450]|uniref:hypothetical protein n=1 Tax=Salinibacterium sp. ZJ450 TaxID=2708338 RepID=UPI0014248631|nr:hypothetical protein [Salinibacterium sp. ZJ450]
MAPLISDEEFQHGRGREIAAEYFPLVSEGVEPLIDRLQTFKVQPRSSLAGDDRASTTDAVSHQARGLLSVGADHIKAVSDLLMKADTMPAFAGFTLTRSALECAGVALWLIGPPDRDTRVLRAIQLSRESLNDSRRLAATAAGAKHRGLEPDDPYLKQFEEMRDARPNNAGVTLSAPSITDRLDAAEVFVIRHTPEQETLLMQWQRTSGLAHGRRHSIWQHSNARLHSADHIGFQVRVTGDLVALTAHFESAVNYLEDGISLLEQRGAAP